jgi:hypothetical protein
MMNSKEVSNKISHLYKSMNFVLFSVLIFQALVMIILSSSAIAFKSTHQYMTYLKTSRDDTLGVLWYDWIIFYLLFIGDYANMIPISLYLMSELIRLFMAS